MFQTLSIESLILIVTLMVVSICMGRAVQRSTHFIYPHDVISIGIIAVCVLDIALTFLSIVEITPWSEDYWAFILCGYFVGFWASSRREYIHLLVIGGNAKSVQAQDRIENKWNRRFSKRAGVYMPYIVPYKVGDQGYIQLQTNKELLKRWILGIETTVETNGELKPINSIGIAHPFFPIPWMEFIPVELFNIESSPMPGRIKALRYNAKILIAPRGMCSSLEMLFSVDAHRRDVLAVHNARAELYNATYKVPRVIAEETSRLLTRAMLGSSVGMLLHEESQKHAKQGDAEDSETLKSAKSRFKRIRRSRQ